MGNLTDIGLGFSLSVVKVGAVLKQLGLREPSGKPAEYTLSKGLAVATPTRTGHEHYMWNRWEIARPLQKQGHSKKVDTRDPLHPVAAEAHKLIQEARMGNRVEDEPAMWSYEAAAEAFQEPLTKTNPHKLMRVALRLHEQGAGLMGDTDDLQFLYQGGPITWDEIQEHRNVVKQVLPAGGPTKAKDLMQADDLTRTAYLVEADERLVRFAVVAEQGIHRDSQP